MKTQEVLETISKLLTDLKFHARFVKELQDLLKKDLRGKESVFFKILETQLCNIQKFGPSINKVDNNERLKGFDKPYYSIHLKGRQFNVRMLIHLAQDDNPLFLCIFNEKDEKSHTSYAKYTSTLDHRLKEILGDETDEC